MHNEIRKKKGKAKGDDKYQFKRNFKTINTKFYIFQSFCVLWIQQSLLLT